MQDHDQDADTEYLVVMNHEEEYSIWPAYKKQLPLGWQEAGKRGTKQECLAYINEVWTDMRPASLRRRMSETKGPDDPA